ncbi:MAG: regulatory protein RecX [Elusimicrobiota bacterium]
MNITAFDYACKLLKYSAKTEKEIIDKLSKKKFNDKVLDSAAIKLTMDELKAHNFINDERFTKDFIQAKLESGNGLELIKERLLQKGIDKKLIKQSIQELDLTEEKEYLFAEKLFAKKPHKNLGNFMASKGFSESVIERLLKKIEKDPS